MQEKERNGNTFKKYTDIDLLFMQLTNHRVQNTFCPEKRPYSIVFVYLYQRSDFTMSGMAKYQRNDILLAE